MKRSQKLDNKFSSFTKEEVSTLQIFKELLLKDLFRLTNPRGIPLKSVIFLTSITELLKIGTLMKITLSIIQTPTSARDK